MLLMKQKSLYMGALCQKNMLFVFTVLIFYSLLPILLATSEENPEATL